MLDRRLRELGIKGIMSRTGRPTTTGKIERFFATYSLEVGKFNTLEYFTHYYNFIRPH
jgi:transposase InsO family protein